MHKWADVLIVDDEKTMRYVMSEVFRLEGITAGVAADGCEAVAYFENALTNEGTTPRLIILDIMMPCMDGYQVYDYISSSEWAKRTAIIIVSAIRDIQLVPGRVPVEILYKPYEVPKLLEVARSLAPDIFNSPVTT